jgi:predicted nucleic acid-binding protein
MSLIRDPKDVHVALAAINAKVDYLITRDKDFTDLDENTADLHQQLAIILPGTFLRECMGWTSASLESIATRKWSAIEE